MSCTHNADLFYWWIKKLPVGRVIYLFLSETVVTQYNLAAGIEHKQLISKLKCSPETLISAFIFPFFCSVAGRNFAFLFSKLLTVNEGMEMA